jgi:hypothetical protein
MTRMKRWVWIALVALNIIAAYLSIAGPLQACIAWLVLSGALALMVASNIYKSTTLGLGYLFLLVVLGLNFLAALAYTYLLFCFLAVAPD